MSTSLPGPSLPARARPSVLVLCVALLLSCSPRDANDEAPVRSQPDLTASHVVVEVPTEELRTTAAVGRLVGRLPGPRRQAVRRQVTAVIDRWWETAYLSAGSGAASVGLDDTTSGARAFPGFTAGARVQADADRELMTNEGLGATSLRPLMRKVRLDLLAINRRARAVTARFDLRLRVAGMPKHPGARRMQVRGRLFLTSGPRGWQIFGYDVSKGWL